MALVVPDVCAALESANGETTGAKYRAWTDKWIAPRMAISGADLWKFRCRMVHQGSATTRKAPNVTRYFFVEPGARIYNLVFQVRGERAVALDLQQFCKAVTGAARDWLKVKATTREYLWNSHYSMRRHPNGISPFVVGVPVIG
jgi:hypothetical protein